MSNTLEKIIKIMFWVLMGVSIVFVALFYFGSVIPETIDTKFPEPTITDIFLKWAYILVGLTAIAAIGFPLVRMFTNPKSAIKTLVYLVIAGVIVAISYAIASDTILEITGYTGTDNNSDTLRSVGAGLYVTYFTLGLAVLAILYSSVSKIFK